MLHKRAQIVKDGTLGERQIRVIASNPTVDRVNDIMVPEGCVLDNYKLNPIVLANHDPDHPIGNANVAIQNDQVEALIEFAPKGISVKADEYCGLYKAGVLRAVSVGFDPIEAQPIRGSGGTRYIKWELMELSCVSVPANPDAMTIERSAATSRRQTAKRRPPLTDQQKIEIAIRQKDRAEGHFGFTEASLKAWLRLEFPGLSETEARKARWSRRESLSLHERFMERKRESDFAKNFVDPAAMTDEEHADYRRRTIAQMAARCRPEPISPVGQLFRYDPMEDGATNAYNLRAWLTRGGRC